MNAIFLDRDGVIIQKAPEGEYISDWSEVKFLAGALQAIADLCHAGYKVMVVTNQRGVATGKIQAGRLDEIHTRMERAVASYGGKISATYCCTHDLSDGCGCRKPKPGMLLQAAADYQLNLAHCWMIGDSASDIAAGKSVHCKTALVSGSAPHKDWIDKPDIVAQSLAGAAERILSLESGEVSNGRDREIGCGTRPGIGQTAEFETARQDRKSNKIP